MKKIISKFKLKENWTGTLDFTTPRESNDHCP